MFTLKVENQKEQVLTLTENEENYQVINIEGLNPPEAEIYTNAVAGLDGEKFKSSKLQMRNIVLTIKINGDVEANRINLYGFFKTGKWCKIYYSNDSRSVFIEGYVETIENDLFTISQEMQISIICPDPYLKSLLAIYADISKIFGNFEFPFAIEKTGFEFSEVDLYREVSVMYSGEAEAGMIITMAAKADILNPTITNTVTGEYMKLNTTLHDGETVIINTNKGNKKIYKTAQGQTTNIINLLDSNSTWLQLDVGVNKFTYTTQSYPTKLLVEIQSNLLYEGV